MKPSVLVLGVGNAMRGDDAAGLLLARALQAVASPALAVRSVSGEATALMSAWAGYDAVIIVDAMHSGSPPGTIRRFDARAGRLPASFSSTSTHAFGVAEAIELARALGQLPAAVVVYGVEGLSYDMGEPVSGAVAGAISRLQDGVLAEARALARPHTHTPFPGKAD
jgi:hydrogenase maturation protease